jgi:hypothetical protein
MRVLANSHDVLVFHPGVVLASVVLARVVVGKFRDLHQPPESRECDESEREMLPALAKLVC